MMKASLALFSALFAAACAHDAPEAEAAAPPRVATSFYPLTYFVETIAGNELELFTPVPAQADPALWKPDTDALLALQEVDLILLNGAGFEQWVSKVSLPESRVIYTADSFRETWIGHDEESHSHGGLAPHSHGAINGHTWVDPVLAERQAEAIFAALLERWPDRRAAFEAGLASLRAQLAEQERLWRDLCSRLRTAAVLASHPSYDYPIRSCGARIENFDLDPAAPLSAAELDEILLRAGEGVPRLMLWESEPQAATRAVLLEHGIESVVFETGEALDDAELAQGRNFQTLMLDNLKRLAEALGN
ncbi:MAG: hypothetical protein CMJ89_00970 [Planctomycetes bacterium]|jgi:zinc transport system substrate-binding protein|nr:hypothetical protein [Planctomycetota bacterium]